MEPFLIKEIEKMKLFLLSLEEKRDDKKDSIDISFKQQEAKNREKVR